MSCFDCDVCIHREVCIHKGWLRQCRQFAKDQTLKESLCPTCIHKLVCRYYIHGNTQDITVCDYYKGGEKT